MIVVKSRTACCNHPWRFSTMCRELCLLSQASALHWLLQQRVDSFCPMLRVPFLRLSIYFVLNFLFLVFRYIYRHTGPRPQAFTLPLFSPFSTLYFIFSSCLACHSSPFQPPCVSIADVVWCRVVGAMIKRHRESGANGDSAMASLVYPLVQVVMGTISLIPTPRYEARKTSPKMIGEGRTGVYLVDGCSEL